MNGPYRIELARAQDDAQLRARMAEDRMEGAIAVSFRREPSYFAGCRLQGDASEVVKCVDVSSGRIVGLGARSTAMMHVNGRPERLGYLADLRIAPAYRRGPLLARGYRFLRRLHEQDPVPFYLTMIYEGNAPAMRTLLGARAGLPVYRDMGRVLTPAIHLDLPRRAVAVPGVQVVRGDASRLGDIVAFLNATHARRQFAPLYRAVDFGNGRLQDLCAEDFFLAVARGRIVGTLAAWDQSRLRQTHVERYSLPLRLLRPVYNMAARITPLKPLPCVGDPIPYVVLACAAAADDDTDVFRALLGAAHEALRRGPAHFAIAALHERDPLAPALAAFRRIEAAGRLFVVHYPEGEERVAALEPRVPYVEAGCL